MTTAGVLVLAAVVLDILLGGGAVDIAHAVLGSVGLALLAVSAAAGAGRH